MVSEVQKHRANVIQIVGFALMTPLGHLAFLLFYVGTICILRSIEIIEGKN